jgi:hypothetical protein
MDHHGLSDRRVSVEMSKEQRISEVFNNSRSTPITRQFEKILCDIHNHFLPLINKGLDNDHIMSGCQTDEVIKEVRVLYYKQLKMDGGKPESVLSFRHQNKRLPSRDFTKNKMHVRGN